MSSMTTLRDRPLTRADWEAMPEHRRKTELLDGEVWRMDMPSPAHQDMVAGLFLALRAVVTADCKVRFAPIDVHVGDRVILEPDLIVARRELFLPKGFEEPPLLVVEASEAQRRVLEASAPLIAQLLRVAEVRFVDAAPDGSIPYVVAGATLALPVAEFIDLAGERARLAKDVGGRTDAATLAQVHRLCVRLRGAVNDGYVHERWIRIRCWAGELFSGGHRNWNRGPQAGAITLRGRIESALEYLGSRLTKIEGVRRADGTRVYGDSLAPRSISHGSEIDLPCVHACRSTNP